MPYDYSLPKSKLLSKIYFLFILLFPVVLYGQKVQLSGTIKDINEEKLPFAHLLILPDSTVTVTDPEGAFSTKVDGGIKRFRILYTGYQELVREVVISKDTSFTFILAPLISRLNEVTITSRRYSSEHIVHSAGLGTAILTKKDLTAIPVWGGEADVIKTLQLLPGTARGVEGSSDVFVRGGAADQNLVMLDGAGIYNTGHLFGFLSVFNPDIIEKVESVNAGFPAEYGGRLSSVLGVTTHNRLAEKTRVSGDIGLITSRLYVEQPIVKDKLSIWLSGRRTYFDQVFKEISKNIPYFFYDINGKIIYKPTKRDLLEFSYFGGKDKFNLSITRENDGYKFTSKFNSANNSQTVRWHHRYKGAWNSNLTLSRTSFDYHILNAFKDNQLTSFSDIEDYGAKVAFSNDSFLENMRLTTGIDWAVHRVSPQVMNTSGYFSDLMDGSSHKGRQFQEAAAYLQQEWRVTDKFLASTGFRGSMAFLRNRTYFVPEPRVALRYSINEEQSVKLSYSRMAQFMYRISNSFISSPTDIWYPVSDKIPPQRSHQYSAAWHRYMPEHSIFFSTEAYYKTLDNQVGYEEGTNLFVNTDFESKLITGKGKAYGLEFLIRKEEGKFTGWLSYSLSWAWRQFDELNYGQWFYSRYDRRHNTALVTQYKINERWEASAVWEFMSGSRFTPVTGQYVVTAPSYTGVNLIPEYSGINQVKMSDSHRLDLGIKYKYKGGNRFKWHAFAGVNNAYNRASPIGIFIIPDDNGTLQYSQPGLFGLLPFFNFGFEL